jgi:hypothetical protein
VPSTGSLPAPRLSAPERDAAPNPSRRVRHCRRHGTATPLCPRTTSSSPESVVGRCVAKRQQQTPRRRGTRARRRRTTSPTNPTTPPPPPSPPPSTRYAPARFLFLSHLRSVARLESTLARFGPTCFSSCSIVRFNPSAIWVQRQRIARLGRWFRSGGRRIWGSLLLAPVSLLVLASDACPSTRPCLY